MGRKRNSAYDEAYSDYLSGLSLEKIAIKMGVTRQCVFKAFKKRGYALRGVNFMPYQIYDGKKFTLRSDGYYRMSTNERESMHRYVWQKEKGVIPKGWDIHHINENKGDNRIENLECLPKEEHTRKYSPHNNQFGKGKRKIEMISLDGAVIRTFSCASSASKELGVSASCIRSAIGGRSKTCLKHKWRYADN